MSLIGRLIKMTRINLDFPISRIIFRLKKIKSLSLLILKKTRFKLKKRKLNKRIKSYQKFSILKCQLSINKTKISIYFLRIKLYNSKSRLNPRLSPQLSQTQTKMIVLVLIIFNRIHSHWKQNKISKWLILQIFLTKTNLKLLIFHNSIFQLIISQKSLLNNPKHLISLNLNSPPKTNLKNLIYQIYWNILNRFYIFIYSLIFFLVK